MANKERHLYTLEGSRIACGEVQQDVLWTCEPDLVTCEDCKKTEAFEKELIIHFSASGEDRYVVCGKRLVSSGKCVASPDDGVTCEDCKQTRLWKKAHEEHVIFLSKRK